MPATRTDLSARLRDRRQDLARATSELTELTERCFAEPENDGLAERKRRTTARWEKLSTEVSDIEHEIRQSITDQFLRGELGIEGGADEMDYAERNRERRALTPAGEIRGKALDAVRSADVPDAAKHAFSAELDRAQGDDLDRLARWTTATSDEAYLRAFAKLCADPTNGHREFSDRELRAFQNVQSVARAMSLTSTAGGFLVPFQLDPSIILTSAGGTNPVRQLARKVTATGDVWRGVSSAGVTASWDAEASEVSDDAPVLGQPTVPIPMLRAFVPFSIEVGMDAANFAQEMTTLLVDAADVLEAQAFLLGTGTGQPQGVVTGLAGTASEVARAGSTLDAADWRATQEALPARFQPNASWLAHLASMNTARATPVGTGVDAPLLSDATTPPRLLGKPIHEASFMDGTVTATAADYLAVYGDLGAGYIVADRIGTTIELIPHLTGANGRPTGQRGFFMFRRVGGAVVNANALRLLNKSA